MAASQFYECLLILIHPGRVPEDQSRATLAGLSGYILHPSHDQDLLSSLGGNLSIRITLLSGGELPAALNEAISNDRVEIIDICIDSVFEYYRTLRVGKADEYSNKLLEILPSDGCLIYLVNSRDFQSEIAGSAFQNKDTLRALTQLGELKYNIRCRGTVNGTLLHLAVAKRCGPLVSSLLESGASANNLTRDNRTALQIALGSDESAEKSILISLLQHGADPNFSATCETPLRLALCIVRSALNRHGSWNAELLEISFAKILLDHGAHLEAAGSDALLETASCSSEALSYLLRASRSTLSDAFKRETLRLWLKGYRELELEMRKKTVDVLLECGFDLFPEDAADKDILEESIKISSSEMVEKLINMGADVRQPITWKGGTALHVAAEYGKETIIRLLVENGADVNNETASGETPLRIAVGKGNAEVVKCLLECGATADDPNLLCAAIFDGSWTASSSTIVKIVRFLAEAGANVNTPVRNGETPIIVASRYLRSGEVIEELLRLGATMDLDRSVFRYGLVHANTESLAKLYLRNGVELKSGFKAAAEEALFHSNESMVNFFMEFSDPRAMTHEDVTILERTALCKKTVIEVVLQYGFRNLKSIFASKIFEMVTCRHPAFTAFRQHVSAVIAARLSINQDGTDYKLPKKWLINREGYTMRHRSRDTREKRKDYEAEVHALKTTKVGDSDVSFYDILNSSLPRIICFLRNESIVEALGGNNWGADFPSYAGMIRKRFRSANRRRTLAKQGIKMLDFMCGHLPKLPFEVKDKIVDYLSNQNLYFLTNFCQLPADEDVTS